VRRCFQASVRRAQILKDTPDIAFGAIGKQMGSEWREMTDAKKKPYTDKAEKAKAKYAKVKAAYGTSFSGCPPLARYALRSQQLDTLLDPGAQTPSRSEVGIS
jgi:hypothetical protein